MISNIGFLVISLIIGLKLASIIRPKLKKSRMSFLVDYSTFDRIFRLFQYFALVMGSVLEKRGSMSQIGGSNIFPLENMRQFQKLGGLMSQSRKILRFIRAAILFQDVRNRRLTFCFANKFEILTTIGQISKFFSDISDLIFYLTDHYGFFYSLGILQGEHLIRPLSTLGDIMWICCSSFLLLSLFCTLERHRMLFKNYNEILKQREVKMALLDICAHIQEVMLGFTFLYPHIASKEIIGCMAISSTILRLSKIGIK